MDKIFDVCCGIDVHKKIVVACLLHGKSKEIREFGTTTRELLELADWLEESKCEIIAMESTASYWKPLYNIFEAQGLSVMVVNAQHMKAVPGRKTDIKDAEWIADLVRHGLLNPSYIPDRDQRELRELVTYRKSLIGERNRALNRLQKMLEGANIKLFGTVSSISGKSARNILDFILSGETFDEAVYDEMYSNHMIAHNLKASKEQIIDDMNGFATPVQRAMMKDVLAHYDEINQHIDEMDALIENALKPDEQEAVKAIEAIPGVSTTSAQAIIAVIGTDMGRFLTDAHISAWAGLCPADNESAKKRGKARSRRGNKLLKTTLVLCAQSASKQKDSFFYAQYNRICAHRGKKRAIVAVAHSILIAIYHVLKDEVAYKDLGADYYNKFNRDRKINSYLKKLKALGWDPTAVA